MKKEEKRKACELCEDQEENIITDPFGSYTGVPLNENEDPVQDVDDL